MIPHNADAEEAVLGCCLSSRDAIGVANDLLSPGDFYSDKHALIFANICTLWRNGQPVDFTTVRDTLRSDPDWGATIGSDLLSYSSNAPSVASVGRYCEIVARDSLGRAIMAIGTSAVDAISAGEDPGEYLEKLQADLKRIDNPMVARDPGDTTFDALRGRPPILRKPWVIPGVLRQDWRAVVVGREGDGKSYLLQQMAVAASYGLHCFTHEPIPTMKVLLIDLENPDDEVQERIDRIARVCESTGAASGGGRLWHRPGGINLRKRSDRAELEEVVRKRRPDLVVLGPLYKAYSRTAAENDEQVAAEVIGVLDDLRSRYEFALLLETHAPKGDTNERRPLVPFGSSLWLRWPELGIVLSPIDWKERPAKGFYVTRFRGDRVQNDWPDKLERGSVWPWEGVWN